jgi:photoactive yellow protein
VDISDRGLLEQLAVATDAELDAMPFGVIKLDRDARVLAYNAYEVAATGLSRECVLGRAFFAEIGPCMNNALVAQRLALEAELDVELDYLFTLHMKLAPVRLRLLQSARVPVCFILVRR